MEPVTTDGDASVTGVVEVLNRHRRAGIGFHVTPMIPALARRLVAFHRGRQCLACRDCGHRVEPAPAEMARRYGPQTTVPDWSKRLVCSVCGSHNTDMVVTGTELRYRRLIRSGDTNRKRSRPSRPTAIPTRRAMNRREWAAIDYDESLFRPADDTRERGGCPGSADCVVPRLRPSS